MKAKSGRKPMQKVQTISIDQINPPELVVRSVMSREKLDTLKASIERLGLIQPIVLKKNGTKFEVIVGHRRLTAHKELKLATIDAIIIADENDMRNEVRKIHENSEREDVNPMDEARFLSRLNKQYKMSQGEIAKSIGRSDAYVSQRLAIMDAPDIIQEALEDGVISFSVAREFAMVDNIESLEGMLHHAINNGVTPAVARNWRLQYEAHKALNVDNEDAPAPDINYDIDQTLPLFICEMCHTENPTSKLKLIQTCPSCEKQLKNAASGVDDE
jgi:ParB family chromosome partitioning protein